MQGEFPFFRSPFNYDLAAASDAAAIPTVGESLTVQSMAEDADINVLMRRFGLTGKMPDNPRLPMYGDFTEVNDYQSALNAINAADEGFMELTADVRARFQNNPQLLLEFLDSAANRDEAIKLGLVKEVLVPPGPASVPAAAAVPAAVVPPVAAGK